MIYHEPVSCIAYWHADAALKIKAVLTAMNYTKGEIAVADVCLLYG